MKTAFRPILCWVAFVVALLLGGFVGAALHLLLAPSFTAKDWAEAPPLAL
ncbi:MAG TPA: hypothetical protein VGG45_05850 [Terracidiphilus sp.]|jgi:hypothetical protein